MFIGKECIHPEDIPAFPVISHGPCEICGKVGPCYDIPRGVKVRIIKNEEKRELEWYEWEEFDPKRNISRVFDGRLRLPIYDRMTEEEVQKVYDWWKDLCKKHNYTGIGAM